MPHLGPVGGGEGGIEGASDGEVTGEGNATFAADQDTAEADAIWFAKAAISPPRAPAFAAAVDTASIELLVRAIWYAI